MTSANKSSRVAKAYPNQGGRSQSDRRVAKLEIEVSQLRQDLESLCKTIHTLKWANQQQQQQQQQEQGKSQPIYKVDAPQQVLRQGGQQLPPVVASPGVNYPPAAVRRQAQHNSVPVTLMQTCHQQVWTFAQYSQAGNTQCGRCGRCSQSN